MKAVTANALRDGRVMYLRADDALAPCFGEAKLFDDGEAARQLVRVLERTGEIANAYLIEAGDRGPQGRQALRETIRALGPSVRPDLGDQAKGNGDEI